MVEVDVLTPWVLSDEGSFEFAVKYDYPTPEGWTDVTAQVSDDVIDNLAGTLVVRGRVSEAQLATLQADSRYPVLRVAGSDSELTPEQRETLRTEIAEVVHPDVARLATDASAAPAVIAETLKTAMQYPVWRAPLTVQAGEVYLYKGNLYEVVQSHTTQSDWTPDTTYALWKRYYNPDNEPEPYRQPQGAHDAYRKGQRVTHNGFTWESLIDANVWVPGSVGTEALWLNLTPPPQMQEWAVGVAYKIGDEVLYAAATYRCLQAHTSITTWFPTASGILNVLWQAVA